MAYHNAKFSASGTAKFFVVEEVERYVECLCIGNSGVARIFPVGGTRGPWIFIGGL